MSGKNILTLNGANIVLPNSIVSKGILRIEGDTIAEVLEASTSRLPNSVDLEGYYLLPGLIDAHSDIIEITMEPREGSIMPPRLMLPAFEISLLSSGITTVFHALLTLDVPTYRRSLKSASALIRALVTGASDGLTLATHFVSFRCELTDDGSIEAFKSMINSRSVKAVSMEDHSPASSEGDAYFNRYCRTQLGLTEEQSSAYLLGKRKRIPKFWNRASTVAEQALAAGLVLLAHDISSVTQVEHFSKLGATIGEFPSSHEVAAKARDLGIKISVGAPNIVHGGSQRGKIQAASLAQSGLVDIVCSDYHPPSLLPSLFQIWQAGYSSLPEAVRMATTNVAGAMRLFDKGSIEPGKRADLIAVRIVAGIPVVEQTYVNGKLIYWRRRLPRN